MLLSIIGSFLGGFGAGLIQVALGGYINALCLKFNSKTGKYFGISNSITNSSLVFGSLISYFAYGKFSNEIFFVTLFIITIISFIFCRIFVYDI
jgi:MFS family permease